ncbi:MAG: hypothetical protein WCF90_08285 [Methanomicrobiales archaeon]
MRGRSSALIAHWIEKGISAYMRLPRFQNLVKRPVLPLRRVVNIYPSFETISLLGKVIFKYRMNGYGVDILAESDIPSTVGGIL